MLKTVSTKYGDISGIEENGYTVFRGIPYAKPPVGELRFRAPQEPDAWEGVLRADKFSDCAVQRVPDVNSFYGKEFCSNPEFILQSNEDCLYLNIWTPAKRSDAKLPVAFWIHGGAYRGGCGAELEFDGEAFCRHDTILVTINYRLGILGFLAHPWLSSESEKKVSGNYGTLDQIAALKWVYENIGGFGGDSENITVFGQSAGCMSTQTLVSSPLAKGMIKKAILQSGGGYKGSLLWDKTLEGAEQEGQEILEMGQISSLEELRSVPAERFVQIANLYMLEWTKKMQKSGKFSMELPFGPIIDGYLLTKSYDMTIEDRELADIPYIIGCCLHDMTKPGEEETSSIAGILMNGAVNFAKKLEEQGKKEVYVYRFERQLPGDDAGAFHSAELWYVFGTLKRCWRPFTKADVQLSEEMIKYWTNFCKTGNPNRPDGLKTAEWTNYKMDSPFIKKFDT